MPKRKSSSVYFTSLEIENVRCFGDRQTLDLTGDDGRPARWTLILGDNGVGKTTLLQSLAWMRPSIGDNPLLAEDDVFLERLLSLGPERSLRLRAKLSIGSTLSTTNRTDKGKIMPGKRVTTSIQVPFDDNRQLAYKKKPGGRQQVEEPLMVVYGANRQSGLRNVEKGELEDPIDTTRLSRLTELYDLEQILSDLDYASKKKELKLLKESLARILPDEVDPAAIQIYPPDILDRGDPSGVYLKTFTGLIPLSGLSLGYQTTLAWTGDLAWRFLKYYPESADPLVEPAIVLIDEICLHLHPLWQLRIIESLSEIFPRTQFVATAHSPLMVQVASNANFVLLRKHEGNVEIVNDPEVVRNWRVDQILVSPLFGFPGTRDRETEKMFGRRDELLDKRNLSAAEKEELADIQVEISKLPIATNVQDQQDEEYFRRAAALLRSKDGPNE